MRGVERVVMGVMSCAMACAPVDRSALDALRDSGSTGPDDAVVAVDAPSVDAPVMVTDQPMPTVDVPTIDVPVTTDRPTPAVDVPVVDVPAPRDVVMVDPCAMSTRCDACTPRAGCGWCGNVGACLSGSGRGPDNGACSGAQWAWTTSMCPATVVDAGPPDTGCRACGGATGVTFCGGSGACLAVQGCVGGCEACQAPTAGGDNCASPVMVMSTGRQRTLLTTCGAADDLNTNCGVSGPDIVVGLRVQRRGAVSLRLAVPAGVRVSAGYDLTAPGVCNADRLLRQCPTNTGSTQSLSFTLDAGTYYLYVVTSQPATVVLDSDLP